MKMFVRVTMVCVWACACNGSPASRPGEKGEPGEPGAAGPTGATGETGPAGAAGGPGARRVYGTGVDGALTLTSSVDWSVSPPLSTLQFTRFTVEAGATLTIPSGLIIRCTETFTNRGTIIVAPAPEAASRDSGTNVGIAGSSANGSGWSRALAQQAAGGMYSWGMNAALARQLLVTRTGGAGGAPAAPGLQGGSRGGGALVVIAAGAVSNEGHISAKGETPPPSGAQVRYGTGGAGGGVLVLASETSVQNSGTIDLRGSAGVDGNVLYTPGLNGAGVGGGGGGGGGLAHFAAPAVTPSNGGVVDVSPGTAGSTPTIQTTDVYTIYGGGGGGASGGACGSGASVEFKGPAVPGDWGLVSGAQATAGEPGAVYVDLINPTPLI